MKPGVLCIDVADHCTIFLITVNESENCPPLKNFKYRRTFSERNLIIFRHAVSQLSWSEIYQTVDTQKAFSLFIKNVTQVYNSCFPCL